MSNYIGMSIEIGGKIKSLAVLKALFEAFDEDISELNGPDISDMALASKGLHPQWYGISNYGLADTVRTFCEENDLSYVHKADADGECDAEICYWLPGMPEAISMKSDQNGNAVINATKIKTVTNFMLEIIKEGYKTLPLHINDENDIIRDIAIKGLKDTDKLIDLIRDKLEEMMPEIPKLPPLKVIKEGTTHEKGTRKKKA